MFPGRVYFATPGHGEFLEGFEMLGWGNPLV